MTPGELKDLFRSEVDDLAEPYFWSDDEFYIYLNEAHDLFVRLLGGIADRRSPLTKISFKAGDQFKKLDERIIRIKGAFDNNNRIIGIKNYDNMETALLEDDYGSAVNAGLDDGRTGSPRFILTDVENNEFQIYPIPEESGYFQMVVYRRPINTIKNEDSVLEIPEYQHLCLLNWVKYKAYLKQDTETFDGNKAAEFRVAFTADVNEAKSMKASRQDRKRVVAYGGIPMS